ncbi:MAG: sodium/glutamate symporter [Planctomycetota bacterium]|jgi:ESS family glutamate:Na+ symporter
MRYELAGVDVLIVSILVLSLGNLLTRKIRFLLDNNIPPAVTGGLICSIVVLLLGVFADVEVTFDMEIRDLLLLTFFSTIGLGAKLRMLAAGGKALAILLACAAVFLVVQNGTGVGLAVLLGAHPGYGLFGGSVSFAGGHGTAIAWGREAEAAGLVGAKDIGIAFATFGLIAGGVIGGPIAGRLVDRFGLRPAAAPAASAAGPVEGAGGDGPHTFDIINTIFALAICIAVGDWINRWLFSAGVMLPGFLTAMVVGIILTNVADLFRVRTSRASVDTIGDVALQIFLSMSLMSMQLASLKEAAGPIVLVLFCQMVVISVFAVFVVFRLMGRDYDAAVISGGFLGLGLGATPVAIANMSAITDKNGPSPKAFLVVPLVGAFFIDLCNALVIKFFLALPMMQRAIE